MNSLLNVLRLMLIVLVAASLATGARAQSVTASIYGRVLDESGAVVPGAIVRALHLDTGTVYMFTSDANGNYDFPQLRLGAYRLEGEMAGFQTLMREGINLDLNQRAKIDLVLKVGNVTEKVEVTAQAPLLDTATAATGQMVTMEQLAALPVAYRVPWSLVLISAGVTPGQRMDVSGRPGFDETANFQIHGSRGVTNEMMIDGVSAVVPEGGSGGSGTVGLSYSPAVDATQEFKVYTNSFAAEFGKSGGGVVTLTLKSGTNDFHGSLYDFLRNDKLDANQWFSNANKLGKSALRQNQYGGSIGGPVWIPGLYNGKNRTFFFFDYQGFRRSSSQPIRSSLPTPEMVNGDFSDLRNARGELVTIYDPLTAGAGQARTPFAGNKIPASRMDPVALKILGFLPAQRRSSGDAYTHLGNNTYQVPVAAKEGQWDLKIDHRFNQHHSAFFRYSTFEGHLDNPPTLPGSTWANPNLADYGVWTRPNKSWQGVTGHTWTLGPKSIIDWRLGYTRFFAGQDWYMGCQPGYCDHPFKPSQAGFPDYIDKYTTLAGIAGFPLISMTNYQALGAGNQQYMYPDTILLEASLTKIKGRHIMKFGFDGRRQHYIRTGGSNQVGSYSFTDGYTRKLSTISNPDYEGNSFASFLLGAPASGSLGKPVIANTRSQYFAFYAQDDFKVTSKLTLNLGVRWDISQPMWDAYDQMSFVNLDVINPLGAMVGLPNLRGGLEFAGQGRLKGIHNTMTLDWNNVAPRLGVAYQPSDKWVVRSGFGILYKTQLGEAVPPPTDSFSVTTTLLASLDGARPYTYLANPFPDGLLQPRRGTDGLLTNVGLGASGILGADSSKVPYILQWNLSIQRQLPGNILLEVAYTGNGGRKLDRRAQNWNELDPQYVSLGNALLQMVPNPFYGRPEIPSTSALSRATVQRGQLLVGFPQFTSFFLWNRNGANSSYNGFQAKVEKRLSHGLTLLASYVNSKTMDNYSGIPSWLGSSPAGDRTRYDSKREWAVSEEDVSQRFIISYGYELPFGMGRYFLNRGGVPNLIFGGWQLNGILAFATGIPINIVGGTAYHTFGAGTQRPNSTGKSAAKSGPAQSRLNAWFDTTQFTNPAPYTLGNVGRTLPDVRTDGISNLDWSLFKNIHISERFNLQYRAEFFNLTNTPVFGAPNRSFGTPDFGKVTSTSNYARQIQMALRLTF